MYRSPTLIAGIQWIAANDAPADDDDREEVAGYLTVVMLASLFNKDPMDIAYDVLLIRRGTAHAANENRHS